MNLKKVFLFASTFLLMLCCALPVLAGNQTITYKGRADLFDFGGGSEYTKTDLFAAFKNVMPGDTLSQTVTIENKATDSDYIKIYLKIKPHGADNVPQTDGNVENMNAFLSKLVMRIYNGQTLIYDDSPDKAGALANGVLLGKLGKNQSVVLTVELGVPIELDNEYANRIGEVDWIFTAEAFDNPITPPSKSGSLTVRKLWKDDGENRPESVTVHLMKNGKVQESVVLSAKNQWTYTWTGLSRNADWSAMEVVPEGYEASYRQSGNTVVITNKRTVPSDKPDEPDVPDNPPKEPDDPDTPNIPDEPNKPDNPDKPTDDEKDVPNDTNSSNDDSNGEETPEVPTEEDEFNGADEPNDETQTVEKIPVTLTVKKIWNDDDDKNRPEQVTIQLYDGENAIETVYLGAWNDWKYTWENLDSNGDWQAVEANIPKGYTPYYRADGATVTITNSAALIQTGQLNLPVAVLSGCGFCLILAGILLITKKRKHEKQ